MLGFKGQKKLPFTIILDPSANKILEELANVSLNGVVGRCASYAILRLLVSDLALLVDHKWLSLEVIEELITKINAIGNQSKVSSFIALKEPKIGGHLTGRYTYWKGKGIQNLCVIINVGRNKLSETYLATSGQAVKHWTYFLVGF